MSLSEMVFGKDEVNDRCYRGGKKHSFESRHDITETLPTINESLLRTAMEPDDEYVSTIIEAFKTENSVYVHDICVWCGEVRKRS